MIKIVPQENSVVLDVENIDQFGPEEFFSSIYYTLLNPIRRFMSGKSAVNVSVALVINVTEEAGGQNETRFGYKQTSINNQTNLHEWYEKNIKQRFALELRSFSLIGFGWTTAHIKKIECKLSTSSMTANVASRMVENMAASIAPPMVANMTSPTVDNMVASVGRPTVDNMTANIEPPIPDNMPAGAGPPMIANMTANFELPMVSDEDPPVVLELVEKAFGRRIQTFAAVNKKFKDIKSFMEYSSPLIEEKIHTIQREIPIMKIGACLAAVYRKEDDQNRNGDVSSEKEVMSLYTQCEPKLFNIDTDWKTFFMEYIVPKCLKKSEEFQARGSGWSLESISELRIYVNQYSVHRGSSHIPTPKFLRLKRAIVNVLNFDDELCFKWAVLSKIHEDSIRPDRMSSFAPYSDELDFTGIRFPVAIDQIAKFERLNPALSINVYMYDDEKKSIYPVRLTPTPRNEGHINLMLLTETSPGNLTGPITTKNHYCWIKNLSNLLSSQISKSKRKFQFCDRCLHHFTSEEKLNEHKPSCMIQNECRITMPTHDENILEFGDYRKQLAVPFIIYADVESILLPTTQQISNTDTTTAYQEHQVYSIGYYFKCNYDNSLSYYSAQRGANCVNWFVREMMQLAIRVAPILYGQIPLNMTPDQELSFQNEEACHICKTKFSLADVKVRDHSHISGTYRGAAHQNCNVLYQESKTIPVVFHNLSGYDSHFFIRELSGREFPGDVQIIPINDQKYISFTKTVDQASKGAWGRDSIRLKFIDSFRFMASSLDKLASYLPSTKKNILHHEFNQLDAEKRALLERKGVFPYDYIDSWSKLDEPSLPSRNDFYSRLTETHIREDDYEFACKMWQEFDINTLGEYSDLYLKTDILLLADIFENFRSTCIQIYGLDPAHYYTAPGFSWDAMLRHTKVKIELFTDIDMLLFTERGMHDYTHQIHFVR